MTCLFPYLACQDLAAHTKNGGSPVKILGRASCVSIPDSAKGQERFRYFEVPCGKCILCHKRRSFEIGVRAKCEAALHTFNSFITLTVSPEHLEEVFPGSKLQHRPFQLFMKRLRKKGVECRYLMCGEYGERSHRPHYHAILFGWRPDDGYFDHDGFWHASKILEEVWPFGHFKIDPVNDNRVFYVAGYQLKGVDSVSYRPYVKWSRRPGLGAEFFDRHWRSIFQHETSWHMLDDGSLKKLNSYVSKFVVGNHLVTLPIRYFDNRLQLHSSESYGILKASKEEYGLLATQKSRQERDLVSRNLKNRAVHYEYQLARKVRELGVYDA